ncbi:hypothetical protein [Ferrimonas balearica]|uniref:hypothetical protein n=1 Tax=Ferrimonas balearica TaxID=44012 RepID=UPI001C9973A4|nr:hypothetical protein [Ferrimonas balearica]MBY5993270.1 hypothetical protein [Ferrimonas balearica]
MTLIRQVGAKWAVAELAEALANELAKDPQVHGYFRGATTLDQVANLVTEITLAEAPALLREQPIDAQQLLPVFAIPFQLMVVKSLQGETLTQAEHLVIPLTHHLAQKPAPEDAPPPLLQMRERVLDLYRRWEAAMTQKRTEQRNMGRHG